MGLRPPRSLCVHAREQGLRPLLRAGHALAQSPMNLLLPLKENVMKKDFNKHLKKTEIVTAKLLNDAGIIGVAMI